MEKKEELRNQTINLLKNLANEKVEIETRLHNQLFQSTYWKQAKTIGITISNGIEWDTKLIIEQGWADEKIMVVPKCIPEEKKLEFYQLHNFSELETVYFNLLEPKPVESNKVHPNRIDLVIVPGVVFHSKGYRIGFGGGYYDRFLAYYNGISLSILHTKQLIEMMPIESHDIAVDHLLTEQGFIK
ncbi:5-formyltetrahydrofolate cyclo-ligase [Ornithinibacillus halotolerans]|uniref:5-formyltetrahydrofolate cyclo-ligase n=1 Tax=Ornithinibacillus halotolerans TaxID=1274357 RepID=A0A916W5W0_9BACI|nr:5-formyltetrahydrofolate cyclo-ligase [Ornithinibacillus halotolerans]GGA68410.1 hypothetical protein GCM10008025_10490 [Ornithinibacillus halotolerans]